MLNIFLRLIVSYYMSQRVSASKQTVMEVADSVAEYTESRAEVIKQNFTQDIQRASKSIRSLLFVLASVLFSGLVAVIWLFAAIWTCPNRDLILSAIIIIPLILSGLVYCRIKQDWAKVPAMKSATDLLAEDWKIFRNETKSSNAKPDKDE